MVEFLQFILCSMHKLYKEFHILFFVVYVVFLVLGWYNIADYAPSHATAGTGDNLSGWAWSSNIGWISFNSRNCDAIPADGFVDTSPPAPVGCPAPGTPISNYGVNVKNNGELEGYAWSDHAGWISFNSSELNIPGCPSADCTAKRVGNELMGFARALKPATSGVSGWDGWISLSCKNAANPFQPSPPPPAPSPPPAGIVGFWKFDDGLGGTAADSSGNNYTGTLINGPTWTAGKFVGALSFDGNNDYVSIPSTFDVAALPFTISAWVNPTNYNDWRTIIGKRDTIDTSDMRFDLILFSGTGNVFLEQPGSSINFSYIPPLSAWTHLVVVAQSSGTQLYVNGVLNQTLGVFSLGTDSAAQVRIGMNADGPDVFLGALDDIRVYNSALSAADVQKLYNGAVVTPIITPNGGTFASPTSVTLNSSTPGASLYYTTDDSAPTIASTLYTGPFVLSFNAVVRTIGVKSGYEDSREANALFTINPPPACVNSNYTVKVSSCDYDNYAWGSETVGWVHFKGSGYGVTGISNSAACFYPVEIESASPSPVTQHAGSQVNWTVYLKSGTGSGSYDFLWSGDAPLAGQTSNPAPTTYSVMGTYSGSITVTDTVTGDVANSSAGNVSIIAGITSFTAIPPKIITGGSVLVQWTTTGFNDGDCALSSNPDDGNGAQSNLAAQGNYTSPALADSTTYTLSCTNLLTGDSDSKLLPVSMLKIPLFQEVKPPVQ